MQFQTIVTPKKKNADISYNCSTMENRNSSKYNNKYYNENNTFYENR